jgi:hypothetical protein
LSGCGTVALGATISLAVVYGTGSNTATQGNDTRLPPAPTAANKLLYDTGSAYAETAACSSASTVLVGGYVWKWKVRVGDDLRLGQVTPHLGHSPHWLRVRHVCNAQTNQHSDR